MSKRVWAVLIGLVLVTGVVQAQDNTDISQSGTGNEALIVQVAQDLTLIATIDQPGNENEGAIIQLGGFENTAGLVQGANYGEALILQEGGTANTATVTQDAPGADNFAFVLQEWGQGNTATMVQTGNQNYGTIAQVDSFDSTASLTQTGNGNGQAVNGPALPTEAADLAQAQYLSGVCYGAWSIFQYGDSLSAITEVTGNCNNTFQYQEGQDHVATIGIVGNENTAFQAQADCIGTTAAITIAGNGNCAGQLLWGGVTSTIDVTGNCNSALVVSGVCCD